MHEILLSARHLTKRFGGLAAVNDVSLDLSRDEIHAVIGPNGAGKSTLTHLLSGDLPSTSGQIQLGAQDVTGWSADRISHQAWAAAFRKPIFSARSRSGKTFAWPRSRAARRRRATRWAGGCGPMRTQPSTNAPNVRSTWRD